MSDKQSFWMTLPGILTAVAGLITAIAALVTALNGFNGNDDKPPLPTPIPAPTPTPTLPKPTPTPIPPPQPTPAAAPWERSWVCTLRLETGGQGVLRFGAAGQDLRIAEWSLAMDTPYDKLMYRSTNRDEAFWFTQTEQITFRLLKEGKSIKRALNLKVAVKGGGKQLDVDGVYRTENKTERWSGTCRD